MNIIPSISVQPYPCARLIIVSALFLIFLEFLFFTEPINIDRQLIRGAGLFHRLARTRCATADRLDCVSERAVPVNFARDSSECVMITIGFPRSDIFVPELCRSSCCFAGRHVVLVAVSRT